MKTIVVTPAIKIKDDDFSYLNKSKKLIDTYIKYTSFDILILTNNVEYYSEIKSERVFIIDYNSKFTEPIVSNKKFNMHIKRLPIRLGMELNYDIVYHHDCDCFIEGWDNNSYDNIIKEDYDVYFPGRGSSRSQLGGLRKNFKHFQNKIDTEFIGLYYDELDNSPNPPETRIIFKNNYKLKLFLEFWDKISKQNNDFDTYYDGVYIGTSSVYAKMNGFDVTTLNEFSKYGKITHGDSILNYYGQKCD